MKHLQKLLGLPIRDGETLEPIRIRRHMEPDEVAEMVARYEDGETVYELAASFGIHRNTVSQFLEQQDVRRRHHERTPVDLTAAADLEARGLNLTQIAAQLGVGRTTLIVARREARQS